VLQAGRRPPVASGFSAFLRTEAVERAAAEQLEHELQEAVTDPYDSHPSLAERIAAVEACAPGDPDTSPPAADVLRDAAVLERGLTAHLFGPDAAAELEPVDWEAVGSDVHLTQARALAGAHGDLLGAATAGDLAEHATALGRIAGELEGRESELAPELAPDAAATLLSDALLVAVADSGWTVEARPAEPVVARRGDAQIFTRGVVEELRSGAMRPEAWQERAAALGIAGLPLQPTGTAQQAAERQAPA
jgi:heat shock protein HtpX